MMIIIIIIIRVFGLAASEISDFLNDSAVERTYYVRAITIMYRDRYRTSMNSCDALPTNATNGEQITTSYTYVRSDVTKANIKTNVWAKDFAANNSGPAAAVH